MDYENDNPFVICKAAAGSGKTFTLVREYLKMALAGPAEGIGTRFRGILAITFTNKAANEMKQRIMSELERMSAGIDPESRTMGAMLLGDLNAMPRYSKSPLSADQLQQLASRLQSAILHHYTDLSVFTIDSFMHRIVRTFAHDLGKPVSFEVLTDQQLLVDEVVGQLMSLAGTPGNEDLTQLLEAYADSNMDADRGYNVEGAIAELARLLFDEDIEHRLKRLSKLTFSDFRNIHNSYIAENRKVEAMMRKAGNDMLDLLRDTGVTPADCYQGEKGFLGYFTKLADGVIAEPNSYVVTSMTGGKLVSGKCPKPLAAELEDLRPDMEAIYARVEHLFEHDMRQYNTRCLILENLYSTALLGRLYSLLSEYSHSNEVIHLSEFNRMINSIVEDEDNPAPFIFERLGDRYHHFLIDEFQDTSVMQWHNLVPLVENGLAHRSESLVVGDAKQAIYRFRQGDVRQFVRLPYVDGMRHHGQSLPMKGNYRLSLLDTNYRTASSVVAFNNDFFSWLVRNRFVDNPLAQEIYIGRNADGSLLGEGDEELRQRVAHDDEGYVGISFVDDEDADAPYAEVLSIVKRMVDERGYSYGDIMILARDNRKLAKMSAYMALNGDIPQTSRQSFLLRSSDAAMAIVAALRVLHDRRDRVAAADLLQRLANIGVIESNHSARMAGDENFDLTLILREEGIDFRPDYLCVLDLYDCCEELVRQLRIDGIDLPYVGSLLNQAASFAARHRQQVGDFLEWLDEHDGLSAASSDQLDAVKLLTIHKAKGLEAPVVICLLLSQNERQPLMWVDLPVDDKAAGPQLPTAYVQFRKGMNTTLDEECGEEVRLSRVDDLNILYVALTRPREQLYLVAPRPKKSESYGRMLYDYLGDRLGKDGRAGFGDAECCKQGTKEQNAKQVVGLQRLSFANWTQKVSIASPAEKAATSLLDDNRRFGTYLHELMSGIEYAADVEAAVERFKRSHILSDTEEACFERLAKDVVSHPDMARFFAEGNIVANESTFVDGGRMERPDRVVFNDKATWIVDFKTGTPVPHNEEQVRSYCRAIAAMGYPDVSGYLAYIDQDCGSTTIQVVPVPMVTTQTSLSLTAN